MSECDCRQCEEHVGRCGAYAPVLLVRTVGANGHNGARMCADCATRAVNSGQHASDPNASPLDRDRPE